MQWNNKQEDQPKQSKQKYPPYYHETMMYHTMARNVGLYTSLSLAALAAARALATNSRHGVAAALVVCSAMFMGTAAELNRTLLWPTQRAKAAPTSRRLPWAMAVAHAMLTCALLVAVWRGAVAFRKGAHWK